MKNKNFLTILAITLVLGMTVVGCDTTTGDGGEAEPTSAKYEGTDSAGNTYVLEITKAGSGKAVYTPKDGDDYVLTINPGNKTSRGKATVSISGSTSSFTLTPAGSTTTFTVTIEKTATAALMTAIEGTIITVDGKEIQVKSNVTPVKEYETLPFEAHRWDYEKDFENYDGIVNKGESWSAGLSLSDFTTHIPKKGDVFKFKISGTTEKDFNWFGLQLFCSNPEDWSTYTSLGGTDAVKLSGTFEEIFTVTINSEPISSDWFFGINMENYLWNIYGDYESEKHGTLGNAPTGTTMATIRNFRISLEP